MLTRAALILPLRLTGYDAPNFALLELPESLYNLTENPATAYAGFGYYVNGARRVDESAGSRWMTDMVNLAMYMAAAGGMAHSGA